MEELELTGWLWAESASSRRFFVVSKAINSDNLRTATAKDLRQSNGGLYGGFNVWTGEKGFFRAGCFPGLCKCFQYVLNNTGVVVAEASG